MITNRLAGRLAVVIIVLAGFALLTAPAAAISMSVTSVSGAMDPVTTTDNPTEVHAISGSDIKVVGTLDSSTAPIAAERVSSIQGIESDPVYLVDESGGDNLAGGAMASSQASSPPLIDGTPSPAIDVMAAEVAGQADTDVSAGPLDTGIEASEPEPMAGQTGINHQGEQFQRPWGLAPGSIVSPATIGGIAFGFLLGAGAYAVARPGPHRSREIMAADALDERSAHGDDPDLDDGDLVPDEAVVERMLLRQNGRMKQSAIVNMTDWSKAKVSRLLTAMAEEGRVIKVRIGRENLICLNGWEPDALRSPHVS